MVTAIDTPISERLRILFNFPFDSDPTFKLEYRTMAIMGICILRTLILDIHWKSDWRGRSYGLIKYLSSKVHVVVLQLHFLSHIRWFGEINYLRDQKGMKTKTCSCGRFGILPFSAYTQSLQTKVLAVWKRNMEKMHVRFQSQRGWSHKKVK